MSIELNSLIVRGGDILSAPIDNELLILNVTKNNYVGLDEIGLRIWELLEKPIRVDELCNQLSRYPAQARNN
ncbi:MAG: PqqD family protein [Planctomycetes bacterium]|nr:PqqD family protein [Planctomycetota bacterium]